MGLGMEFVSTLFTGHVLPAKSTEGLETVVVPAFSLPISYLDPSSVFSLHPVVASDLELVVADPSQQVMYEHVFQPKTDFAKQTMYMWSKQYTTDVSFLEQTQDVIQCMGKYHLKTNTDPGVLSDSATAGASNSTSAYDCVAINAIWKDLKKNDYFLEKYGYIEWDMFKEFNKSSSFLQTLTLVNISSPIMSFIIPILFLLFPFLILKFQGIPITFSGYIDVLKEIAKNHFIGKALMNLQSLTWDKAAYVFMTFGLYIYQIYQNMVMCLRFYENIRKINESLIVMRDYIDHTVLGMNAFVEMHHQKPAYTTFCRMTNYQSQHLTRLANEFRNVVPFQRSMYTKIVEIGYLLKCYYELHSNMEFEKALEYSFGFNGYIENMTQLYDHKVGGSMSMAEFYVKDEAADDDDEDQDDEANKSTDASDNSVPTAYPTKMTGQYYPPLWGDDSKIKNNCSFDKNMIITGPNASGKTTLLKSTLLNIIFTQQFGFGFYGSCTMLPYTHIHSYLNIPDTSGRDSLFQAESRRCKEIIDVIHDNRAEDGNRHFCIFDELYSGTNPVEATKAAYAFLQYLAKFEHVDFILTTHYVSICSKMKKSARIQNYKMDVLVREDGTIKYTYMIKAGVSKVEGAIRILQDMNYPSEIVDSIKQDVSV